MDNVNLSVVANNRKPISLIGANLGTQYFKAGARASWPDFEKAEFEVRQGGNVDFILNRSPRRYRLTGHDVLSVNITTDAAGATKVILNKDDDNSAVSIPIVSGMDQIGKVTEDAIGKALRGDSNIIFSDPEKLATQLNMLNNDEKNRLVNLREQINKFIAQLDSAINENNKKCNEYKAQMVASSTATIPGASSTTTVVVTED